MARKLLLVNLLILAGVVLLAQQLVASWQDFRSEVEAAQPREFAVEPPATEPPPASLAQFLIIQEKNLFSRNRGNEDLEEDAEEQVPELRQKPQLLSVSTFGGEKQAVLTVFTGRRGNSRDNRIVKVGDRVEGFEISEIQDHSLSLAWGGEVHHTIELEPASRERRTPQRQASGSVNIITIGAAAAAVETSTATEEEDEGRGLEVGTVAAPQQTRSGRGSVGAARQGQGTRGVGARGGRGVTNQQNNQTRPGTVGFGSRPPQQPTQPPPR